ncbi:solute carrier family 22 member 21-like [Mercenaria mercenaria]|uniref:solute carrier family 22 member 21-like n=1 Tax=Mercenaria mercenaria TaxID=6596 RepID=UPI00234F09B7|nr:solute carrier family 22 member 21-like [Mercenaria mercenaria]
MGYFVPESFRWLVSKMKFEQADRSIDFVANVNRVPKPDLKKIFDSAATEINTPSNTTTVFSVSTAWFSMSLGMESISVNIYLTIFLINLVDIPVHLVAGPLLNRLGRKKLCFVSFGLSGILSCVSGILQHFDQLPRSSVSLKVASLVISLLAKMAVSTAYLAITIFTTELYPTVVRCKIIHDIDVCVKAYRLDIQIEKTIGYGFQTTVGRIGAIAAPLLIYLDKLFPGLMYFTCGVLIFLSAGTIARLKETKDVTLPDSI